MRIFEKHIYYKKRLNDEIENTSKFYKRFKKINKKSME
jgi:hypothetical protein